MSLISKAFYSGITRVFSLPRLSVPLILTLGLTLGAVLTVIAITSALLFQPLQGVTNESQIKTVKYQLSIQSFSFFLMYFFFFLKILFNIGMCGSHTVEIFNRRRCYVHSYISITILNYSEFLLKSHP